MSSQHWLPCDQKHRASKTAPGKTHTWTPISGEREKLLHLLPTRMAEVAVPDRDFGLDK